MTRIERRAAELRDRPGGVVELFDYVLAMQSEYRSLGQVLAAAGIAWFTGLADRTVAAFAPLVERARADGAVHPGVGVADVMLAFSMAGGALADNDLAGRPEVGDRLRGMLHRALFTEGYR